jgi:acyl-CoA thioesterase
MTWPAHVERMWADDRASRSLGMRLLEVTDGRAVVEMVVRPEFTNGHGIGHGGLTFALADSAFAFACNSRGPVTVAHSAEIRFHTPVHEGDLLTATATEVERDGRRGRYQVDVRADDRLVARFLGRSTELRKP